MEIQTVKRTAPSANALSQSSILLSGITWQDSLLQSYRNYMVVSQSIFIAVCVVLFSAQFQANDIHLKLILVLPFFLISVLAVMTLKFLSGAIVERAKSVDWWQKRLLKHESNFSIHQHYSTFCVAKEHQFAPPSVEAHALSDAEIERLLRAETPKARKVFGWFVPGFYLVWFVLMSVTLFTFPWGQVLVFKVG